MDDLIGEFITETSESLAVLDLELVKLEQNPNDQNILGNIFRLVHTIKGTCGFLGLPRLESVAHAGENVLGKIRDGAIIVSPEAISIVLEALDRIKSLIEHLANTGSEPVGEDKDLIRRLNAFADSNGASSGGPAVAEAAKPVEKFEEPRLDGMFSPAEMKIVSSTSTAEMDALEAAFANASSTLEGGMDFTRAPDTYLVPDAAPAEIPTPTAPVVAKQGISEQTKASAIKQGLDTDAKEGGAHAQNQSIRVSLDVLENLMQMVGELVLTRNQLLQVVRHREERELKGPLQQLSQITTELQESVMKTRMQPIGNAWSKFPRLIRDLSQELKKKIDLKMVGEATELDRQLLEMIKDPLTHMVRNSCDHGLEVPADRAAMGKPEVGTVTLSAFHEGGHIIIEIKDDGRGLNLDRIKQKILEKDLATEPELERMSDEQIMQYIFAAGFSTAEKVTSVSGRGVGMDVVRTNIEKIGGTVSLTSAANKGSTFHIKIPLTLAIVSVLLVETSGHRFAVPQLNVVELVRVGVGSDHAIETISQSSVLRLRDKLLPLLNLRDILKLEAPTDAQTKDVEKPLNGYVAVLRIGATDFGLILDKIYDTEEIVVKPVSPVLGNIDVYSGNTILGDGSVIMILDPNGLAKSLSGRDAVGDEANAATSNEPKEKEASFLVFRAGEGAPKAVPLELVSRLEVIDAARVELSGKDTVVQYRGDLMRLKTLPGMSIPTDGGINVVVFTYDSRTIGLVVDSITDIIEAPLAIKLTASEEYCLGSIVIMGKTTDVVDVGYLLKDLANDLTHVGNTAQKVRGIKLLMVEDSLFFRKLIVPYLEDVGYIVSEASGPQEALELVQTKQADFDLVITDIEMPEMDGFELTARLRADPRMAHLPIIAFTSTANDIFRQRGIKVGMDAIILKTDREALLLEITSQLKLKKEVA